MDALQKAVEEVQRAENQTDYTPALTTALQFAQAYAAIAQAEQLKRIADMMEGCFATYLDPAVFASDADESLEDHHDNRRRAQEQMDGLRRGMGLE